MAKIYRVLGKKGRITIPFEDDSKSAKILYPSRCEGAISTQGKELTVTLNSPCTAAIIEMEI